MKKYEKDGKAFVPPLHVGDHVVYNPTHEMLIEAGYTVREESSGGAAKSRVYKFDKYKIVVALGDKWAQKKTELVTESELSPEPQHKSYDSFKKLSRAKS